MDYLCVMKKMAAIWNYKCPRCREGNLFNQPFKIDDPLGMPYRCNVCGQRTEPEPGFYFGAMFISYGLSGILFLTLGGIMILGFGMTGRQTIISVVIVAVITFLLNLRLSRSIWIHLMVKYKPSSKQFWEEKQKVVND